jgi:hypothetical protein
VLRSINYRANCKRLAVGTSTRTATLRLQYKYPTNIPYLPSVKRRKDEVMSDPREKIFTHERQFPAPRRFISIRCGMGTRIGGRNQGRRGQSPGRMCSIRVCLPLRGYDDDVPGPRPPARPRRSAFASSRYCSLFLGRLADADRQSTFLFLLGWRRRK